MRNLIKCLFILLGCVIAIANAQVEVKDSTITITWWSLPEVLVQDSSRGKKESRIIDASFRSLYYGDTEKKLTLVPGVISPLGILAQNSVDNLPGEFTRTYYGGTRIPIMGKKTVFQGGISIVNANFFGLEVNQDFYSAGYGSIDGVKIMKPESYSGGIKLFSDFIARELFISGGEENITGRFSIGQVKVLPQVLRIFPELGVLPSVGEFEGSFKISGEVSLEGYIFSSAQKRNFSGSPLDVDISEAKESSIHNLGVVELKKSDKGDFISLYVGYELEEDSSILISRGIDSIKNLEGLKNLSLGFETGKTFDYKIGIVCYSFLYWTKAPWSGLGVRENVYRRNVVKVYSEKEFLIGNFFLLGGSFSVDYLRMEKSRLSKVSPSGMLRLSYFPSESVEIEIGGGRYSSFLFDRSGEMGKMVYQKVSFDPDESRQASFKFKLHGDQNSFLNSLEFSFFFKRILVEYSNLGRVWGHSNGFRFWARSSFLNSRLSGYAANSKIGGKRVLGTLNHELKYSGSVKLVKIKSWEVFSSFEADFRSGLWSKNQTTNNNYQLFAKSSSLNLGFTFEGNIADSKVSIDITGFNLIGQSPELVRYNQNGETLSKKAPRWGNLLLSISIDF